VNAKNSAVVNAILGTISLSIDGSEARLRNTIPLSNAPVFSKSLIKYFASSSVIPIATNITAKLSLQSNTVACLAI